MNPLGTLAEALGIAYAGGISLYATVAVLGIAERLHWIGPLPGALGGISSVWIIALATVLAVTEFLATLVPGLASAWETVHTFIRPPASALLAAATVWHGNEAIVLAAALLGGGLALTTHGTKLGLRYAIDTSPEPVTNAASSLGELGIVTVIALTIWRHPILVLVAALVLLVCLMLVVRAVWRAVRRVFARNP
jgi:hypothetical protein